MALSSRAPIGSPSNHVEYLLDQPTGRRIGIALSGGGIRSAAFNLGALQALQQHRILASADYLAAVSGGSYVASALMISQAYSPACNENGTELWAHGSPEERHLRSDTNYLAPGFVGRVWMFLSVVYGFVLNYIPFLLGAFVLGRLLGWLVHWQGMKLADLHLDGLNIPESPVMLVIVAAIGLLVVFAVVLVAVRRFRDAKFGVSEFGESRSEPTAAILVLLAIGGVALLFLPVLAGAYAVVSEQLLSWIFGESAPIFQTKRGRLVIAGVWLVLAMLLAVIALMLSRRLRARRSMLVISATASGGLVLVPLLSSLDYSARHGLTAWADYMLVGVAVGVMLLMGVFVHNRRYSMHPFYRERLSSAFALERVRDDRQQVVAKALNYRRTINFSEVGKKLAEQESPLPKLIVCCAANVTSAEVPVGRYAESFTFECDKSGGPRFDYHETERFESSDGPKGTDMSLPSIMAASGAALSPLMGRFTYPPLRFLMALTDVRLGVWVKNPRHPDWANNAPKPSGQLARARAFIKNGWQEPGALYVLREALGALDLKKRFIYLTDGGHWENLGIVELLRRRCTHVLCFDASSDQHGGGQDVGRAIALARSELGVEIEVDPLPTMPSGSGEASSDSAVKGVIKYPGGQDARLIYAKATMPADASWDLKAFQDRDGRFPNHSTGQQMFSDEQFEAYRSLGHAAGLRAVALLNIPPSQLDGVPRAHVEPRGGSAGSLQVSVLSANGHRAVGQHH